MIRVLIADDHPVVRQGLRQIVAAAPGMAPAGEACDGNEVLEKVRRDRYDVLVLDITMPGLSGLDLLKQLKAEQPQLPVVMLTLHSEEQYAVRFLRAGAAGYLTKDSPPAELIEAIRRAAKGGRYVSSALAERLALRLDAPADTPLHSTLSDREFQVLCLLAEGRTVTDAAQHLALSVKTVSTHRARVLKKMHMSTTAELIRYAIEHQLAR